MSDVDEEDLEDAFDMLIVANLTDAEAGEGSKEGYIDDVMF